MCHCNGYLREDYLRELLIVKENFTLPFIAKLFGDYVIEIVKVLQKIYIVMETNQKRIAILIDADNAQPSTISKIIEEVETYGKILIRWAFGDWTTSQLRGWKDTLPVFSIKPIQSFAHAKEKNSTDITLVINAMNLIHTHPHITGFCIVSSDSDFMQLAMKLIENNKFVMGIGRKQTPTPFVNACHVFKYIDDFAYLIPNGSPVEEPKLEVISTAPKEYPTSAPISKEEDPINLLKRAMKNLQEGEEGADLGKVVNEIKNLDPNFTPKSLGKKNYVKLFESLPAYFQMVKKGSNYLIKLRK